MWPPAPLEHSLIHSFALPGAPVALFSQGRLCSNQVWLADPTLESSYPFPAYLPTAVSKLG